MGRTQWRVWWLPVAVAWVAALGAAGDGARPVLAAAKSGDRAALRSLLKQRADVNEPEADGMTALHWVVQADDAESAELLIRAGANVKATNRLGIGPLSLAALMAARR
jgi:ankyrin repeat protein